MSTPNLSTNDISALIDHLLKSKDPAVVGLKKILKNQKALENLHPLRSAPQEEFFVAGATKKALSENDLLIVKLEKQINSLRIQVETLQKELPQRERSAREKGREEGISQGRLAERESLGAQNAAQINELQKRVTVFCTNVEQSKNAMYINAHQLLLSLCFALTEKIICTETSSNPQVVLSVIKKALSYIADKDRLLIRVAKDDMDSVSGRKDFWKPVGENLSSLSIEPDERVERGGCIIESNSGMSDARLGVQMAELKDLVEAVWKSTCASEAGPGAGQAGGAP